MKQLAFLILSSTPSLENIAHIAKPLILTSQQILHPPQMRTPMWCAACWSFPNNSTSGFSPNLQCMIRRASSCLWIDCKKLRMRDMLVCACQSDFVAVAIVDCNRRCVIWCAFRPFQQFQFRITPNLRPEVWCACNVWIRGFKQILYVVVDLWCACVCLPIWISSSCSPGLHSTMCDRRVCMYVKMCVSIEDFSQTWGWGSVGSQWRS